MIHDVELLRLWIRIVAVITSLAVTSLPVMYLFSPWRSRPIGKFFMLLVLSYAAAVDMFTLFSFWRPGILVVFWVDAIVLTGVAISASALTWLMWRMNYSKRKKDNYAAHW